MWLMGFAYGTGGAAAVARAGWLMSNNLSHVRGRRILVTGTPDRLARDTVGVGGR